MVFMFILNILISTAQTKFDMFHSLQSFLMAYSKAKLKTVHVPIKKTGNCSGPPKTT